MEDEKHTNDDFDKAKDNVMSNDVPFTDQSSTKDTGKKEEFTSDTQYPESRSTKQAEAYTSKINSKIFGSWSYNWCFR